MKICESWLRDWVSYDLGTEALAERLTMLGLEVEAVTPVAPPSRGIVVGEVLDVRRHPAADKLSLCRVSVGAVTPLNVVCGAGNVRAGGRYPTAAEGAELPGGTVIRARQVRGEPSEGMLCSAAELGLDGAAEGLLELDADAPLGRDIVEVLRLDDHVLELNITPNRGDCLSVAGLAREVALSDGVARHRELPAVPALLRDALQPIVADPADCPRFVGRVIREISPQARTPLWLRERLRRCGVRPVHPVVDVTNYVMLDLGQPMHAYDLDRLEGQIAARRARPGERLVLLDGREVELDPQVLVIADERKAVGMAGIMGGVATAVTSGTRHIFLESALFARGAIAGRARRYALQTDASQRFERGVDPTLQARAVERATALLGEITGGRPGPLSEAAAAQRPPDRVTIRLRRERLRKVLGLQISPARVNEILGRLGMTTQDDASGWKVVPPPFRFDIEREEDLIEEIARVHGYHQVPETAGRGTLRVGVASESRVATGQLRSVLIARGYQEAITYSFVSPEMDRLFADGEPGLALSNPISADLAVMRQSLWPGLIGALQNNLNRQQRRMRLFEYGVRFICAQGATSEVASLAGLTLGARLPEQWGAPPVAGDIYDMKSDVEALLALTATREEFSFRPARHPALHPGRSAEIRRADQAVGWIGELHPALTARLELPAPPMLFELTAERAFAARCPRYQGISRFPAVRRDLALVVNRDVNAAALVEAVRQAAPAVLREVTVFDIYAGPQVGPSEKSVAMGLILQDASRTLTDAEVDRVLAAVTAAVSRQFNARIRE